MNAMDPQRKLTFGDAYPLRPPFWFAHAIRIMSHYAVSQDVGLLGYAILTEVVLTEDKRGYTSPPTFWQRSFQDRFGRGKEAVSEAIGKCVDHGWLHWDQPYNNRAATAWLLIPDWVDEAVINRGWSEIPTNNPPNNPPNNQPNRLPDNPPSSSLSCPIPTKADDWQLVAAAMESLGIQETEKPLRLLQERKVSIELALGVLRYASEVKLWKPGKVRCRLCQLKPGQDPTDRRLWMQPDHGPVLPASSVSNAAETRARDLRLRQLEIDFEQHVKGKSIDELLTTFELPESLQVRLRHYGNSKFEGIRNDTLRLDVLTEIERRFAHSHN